MYDPPRPTGSRCSLDSEDVGDKHVTLFGAAGLLFFSDFKADGVVHYDGSTGYMVRLGLELSGLFGGS